MCPFCRGLTCSMLQFWVSLKLYLKHYLRHLFPNKGLRGSLSRTRFFSSEVEPCSLESSAASVARFPGIAPSSSFGKCSLWVHPVGVPFVDVVSHDKIADFVDTKAEYCK